MKVGWIGLGQIGLPMAERVAASEHQLVTCGHRNQEALAAIRAAGAKVVGSPREVAEGVDLLVSMVRDQPQTESVLLGDGGALASLPAGSILAIMSTLSADFCQRVRDLAAERGVTVLDAPVSGGAPGARAGTLSIMIGGPDDAVARARPVFEHIGSNLFHLGDVGSGQIAKIVNNAIKIAILAVTTESLDVGVHAGLDVPTLLDVIRHSTGNSRVVEKWDYYYSFKRDHHPGGPLDILYKDVGLLLALAEQNGVTVPVSTAVKGVDVGRLVSEPAATSSPSGSPTPGGR